MKMFDVASLDLLQSVIRESTSCNKTTRRTCFFSLTFLIGYPYFTERGHCFWPSTSTPSASTASHWTPTDRGVFNALKQSSSFITAISRCLWSFGLYKRTFHILSRKPLLVSAVSIFLEILETHICCYQDP